MSINLDTKSFETTTMHCSIFGFTCICNIGLIQTPRRTFSDAPSLETCYRVMITSHFRILMRNGRSDPLLQFMPIVRAFILLCIVLLHTSLHTFLHSYFFASKHVNVILLIKLTVFCGQYM